MFFRTAGFWIASSLVMAGCASQPLTVERSIAMTQPNFELGELTPQTRFALKDVIRVETYLT